MKTGGLLWSMIAEFRETCRHPLHKMVGRQTPGCPILLLWFLAVTLPKTAVIFSRDVEIGNFCERRRTDRV